MTKYSHTVIDGVDYYIPDWNWTEDEWLKIPEFVERFKKTPNEQQEIENTGKTFERLIWTVFGTPIAGGLGYEYGFKYASAIFIILSNLILNNIENKYTNAWKGRIWFSKDGSWQYSRFKRDGYMKSKYPDMFGNPCYCKKIDIPMTGRKYSFDHGQDLTDPNSHGMSGNVPVGYWHVFAFVRGTIWLKPTLMGSCGIINANNPFVPIPTASNFILIATEDIKIDGYEIYRAWSNNKYLAINYTEINGIRNARIAVEHEKPEQYIFIEYR